MSSLGEKLVHLSLEIEDRTKSAELLQQLIADQSSRHESELSNFENEQDAFVQNFTTECKESLATISHNTEALEDKRKTLESQIGDLLAKKKEAEYAKKKNLDAVRREIAEAKENAHKSYKQERSQREKEWFDGRVSEIHKLTWKGIQPNVERLSRKHTEQCEEINSKTQYSKQKLELQCENDLSDRIQEFQRSDQQSNACITQRSNFANMLLREQNEHAMSLMKLKDKLMQEEESTKKMHSLQLETLTKDNDVALSKIRCSNNLHQPTQQLFAQKETRQQELESKLDQVGKEVKSSKTQWEESWMASSALRVEKKNKQKIDDLIKWRKREVNELIKRSIIDQSKSPKDIKSQLTVSYENNVATLNENLNKVMTKIKEAEAIISRQSTTKDKVIMNFREAEKNEQSIDDELKDMTNRLDQKRRQQKQMKAEGSTSIEQSLLSIRQRTESIKQEVASAKIKAAEEMKLHSETNDKLMQAHEAKLDELENYATRHANEIDGKLYAVNNMIKERDSYLSRAQNLLDTRYNVNK